MRQRGLFLSILIGLAVFVRAVSAQPPAATTEEARREIAKDILSSRPNIFDGLRDSAAVEVVAIKLSGWRKEDLPGVRGGAPGYASNWTAKLRFKEPIGFILYQLDGVKVVLIVANSGDELEYSGLTTAAKLEGQWGAGAIAQIPADGGPWKPLWEKAGEVTMAYRVIGDANRNTIFRGATFEAVSKLAPYVAEGSAEEKALVATAQERQWKAQQAAAQAQAARRQREAEEKQKAYEAEQQRLREKNTEKQRLAQEEAKRKAEEARHTQLSPLVRPFQSPAGAVIASDAIPAMGMVILQVDVDEPGLTAKGRGAVAAASDNLIVTLNGVHHLTIPSIPKLGGVLLALPPDLELLDLRFEAQGIVQSRAIALIE